MRSAGAGEHSADRCHSITAPLLVTRGIADDELAPAAVIAALEVAAVLPVVAVLSPLMRTPLV